MARDSRVTPWLATSYQAVVVTSRMTVRGFSSLPDLKVTESLIRTVVMG